MRVTEQIDALDIMGINSANFLVLPKILACIIFNPLLIAISIFIGVIGGYIAGSVTNDWTTAEFTTGIQMHMPNLFSLMPLSKRLFCFHHCYNTCLFRLYRKGGSLGSGAFQHTSSSLDDGFHHHLRANTHSINFE